MANVCYGKEWKGFLTKPSTYLRNLEEIVSDPANANTKNYALLMDSDTMWATNSLSRLWHKFDCARKSKDLVVSTEMSCWIGQYCTKENITRWYSDVSQTPSYSPFVNSGLVMGKVSALIDMLRYIIVNNGSYFLYAPHRQNKYLFDDQYAMSDYAISVAPRVSAIDYHQQLFASVAVLGHDPQTKHDMPFVCKRVSGDIDYSCMDFTARMYRNNFYVLNNSTCGIERRPILSGVPVEVSGVDLARDPAVWHGNGVGKKIYMHKLFSHAAFNCAVKRLHVTDEEYMSIDYYMTGRPAPMTTENEVTN